MLDLPAALAGVKVFPCQPGDKLPALDFGWQTRATSDPVQLAAWNAGMDGLNWGVACGPSGLFVFDIDPQGMGKWNELQDTIPGLREAVARAFTVRTPRGGLHVYFRGQGPTTAGAISPGIDTRGGYLDEQTGKLKSIGYVVLPGSITRAGPKTVDGAYEYLGGQVLPMPAPVLQIVPDRKRGTVVGLDRPPNLDQPRNEQWARDLLTNYVKEGRVSIEGAGGNNTAYQVAASILDKAISPARCFELMDELWNPHCSPPWEDFELEQIVGNAVRYGEDTTGSKGFEDNATAFEKFAGLEFATVPEAAPSRHDKVQWIDDYAASVRDPVWLLPGVLPAHGTGMLFGASGSYKSFLALDMASCLAHGHAGQWGAPPVPNDVIYFAGEAPVGTAKQRRPAWLEWQGISSPHRLAIFPRVPFLGDHDGWAGVKLDIEELGIKPSLIIIDTFSRLLTGFDENSTKDAVVAVGFVEDLARFYECFVLVIHHTGKDENKGARGSSVFQANFDTMLATKKRGSNGAEFRVKKHKDADAPDDALLFKTKEVGRSIVLEKTESLDEAPSAGASKTTWSDPAEITTLLSEHGGRLSHSLLCMTLSSKLGIDKGKVAKELTKRGDIQWLRDGDNWRVPGNLEHDL